MEQSLFASINSNNKIHGGDIQRARTTVQVLDVSPVSEVFAMQLAKQDSEADKRKRGKALLPESDYFESYYTNGARSITAKYTYFNAQGQRDVFIASSLFNNDECSVRFNGYVTLSREF